MEISDEARKASFHPSRHNRGPRVRPPRSAAASFVWVHDLVRPLHNSGRLWRRHNVLIAAMAVCAGARRLVAIPHD